MNLMILTSQISTHSSDTSVGLLIHFFVFLLVRNRICGPRTGCGLRDFVDRQETRSTSHPIPLMILEIVVVRGTTTEI